MRAPPKPLSGVIKKKYLYLNLTKNKKNKTRVEEIDNFAGL